MLLAWPEDSEAAVHPVARLNRQRMQRSFDVLSAATDADGQPLRVLKVPLPKVIERRVFLSAAADVAWSREWTAEFFPPSEKRRQGDPMMQVASSSYLNFVVANGVVVLPDYSAHGSPAALQERVQQLMAQATVYRTPLAIHLLSLELLLVWFPFGKLMHAFTIFAARGSTGMLFERKGASL